jgi:hypothetical protein
MAKNIAPNPAPGTASASANARNASAAPSKNTTLVPKKGHSKSVDPYVQPVANRAYAAKERSGAAYGIRVGFEAHTAPEAGMTQANGRVLKQAINRSAPNFRLGASDNN